MSDERAPVTEPPSEDDLERIEAMLDSQPEDYVVRVKDIAPLVRRLIAEVRRLNGEHHRLLERVRNLES